MAKISDQDLRQLHADVNWLENNGHKTPEPVSRIGQRLKVLLGSYSEALAECNELRLAHANCPRPEVPAQAPPVSTSGGPRAPRDLPGDRGDEP